MINDNDMEKLQEAIDQMRQTDGTIAQLVTAYRAFAAAAQSVMQAIADWSVGYFRQIAALLHHVLARLPIPIQKYILGATYYHRFNVQRRRVARAGQLAKQRI